MIYLTFSQNFYAWTLYAPWGSSTARREGAYGDDGWGDSTNGGSHSYSSEQTGSPLLQRTVGGESITVGTWKTVRAENREIKRGVGGETRQGDPLYMGETGEVVDVYTWTVGAQRTSVYSVTNTYVHYGGATSSGVNQAVALTTVANGSGWTTTTTTTQTTDSLAIVGTTRVGTMSIFREDYDNYEATVSYVGPASAESVSVYPAPGQILVYFYNTNIPFTDGQTTTGSTTYASTLGVSQEFSFSTSETYEYYGYVETFYYDVFTTLGASFVETTETPPQFGFYSSYQTIAVPRNGWGSADPITTMQLAIRGSVVTFSTRDSPPTPLSSSESFSNSASSSRASGSSEGEIWLDGIGFRYTSRSWPSISRLTSSSESFEYGSTGLVPVPKSTSFFPTGPVYLVATSQNGVVIASGGFHTAPPARSFASSYISGKKIPDYLGQARPGVSLYVPFAAPTPLYTQSSASFFAGNAPLNQKLCLLGVPIQGAASETVAFTTTGDSQSVVTPNVVQITRTNSTVGITNTINVQGNAPVYGNAVSYAGGYSELQVTWTLVVGTPGVVVAYVNNSSKTTEFKSPTTTTYSGEDGSYFSFIPNAFERVLTIPFYNYDEF